MNSLFNIVLISFMIGLLFIFYITIRKKLANKYVKDHRQVFFEITKPLSAEIKETYDSLMCDFEKYTKYISEMQLNNIYKCSLSVLQTASVNPIKSILKYSNVQNDENTLEMLDFCIEWTETKEMLLLKILELNAALKELLPRRVQWWTVERKLTYKVCDIRSLVSTSTNFTFTYTSAAGKSNRMLKIPITSEELTEIREQVSSKLGKTEHKKTQRALMTNDLREAIKKRDNYTCCICGNSVYKEPNLLLEIDHIIPVSKGGKTEASNLQTLCWRCNRTKSSN